MSFKLHALATLFAVASAAQTPLPALRTEATDAGSIFHVRNGSTQPLTAYLIELVNYPGSSYSLWQDEAAGEPVPPGAEKSIRVVNMTVGAVPEYCKLQAAIYADGTTAGIPEKVMQFVERRRHVLATTRELISRIEKARGSGPSNAAVSAALKEWSDSMPAISRANRNSQAAINQAAANALISDVLAKLGAGSMAGSMAGSVDDALAGLRATERSLTASKPAL